MIVRMLLLSTLLFVVSCGSPSNPSNSSPAASNAVSNTPAPGSKFSRIRIGMGKREVQDIIGPPTDEGTHITGKAFIPFYFGGDRSEIDAHYKNEGILTYASRARGSSVYELVGIAVDARESGYIR